MSYLEAFVFVAAVFGCRKMPKNHAAHQEFSRLYRELRYPPMPMTAPWAQCR